jgi:hypothetical protein
MSGGVVLSEPEAIAEYFNTTAYLNIAMAAVGTSTASVAVLRHKVRSYVSYRVPIIDRTRCPVHTAATAMQAVAIPTRPIRQAKSLDLWIKRNAGHAARIMVN